VSSHEVTAVIYFRNWNINCIFFYTTSRTRRFFCASYWYYMVNFMEGTLVRIWKGAFCFSADG